MRENMKKYLLCAVTALYAGMSAFAAVLQAVGKGAPSAPDVLMVLGGALLAGAVALCLGGKAKAELLSFAGAALIVAAALLNGIRGGNLHIVHHIVRITLSAFLVWGFYRRRPAGGK